MLDSLLLATNNKGKIRELRALLEELPLRCVSPEDLGIVLDVPETGTTYAANASLKARAFHSTSGLAVLADDTGLEVDLLGGAPGLHSARFSTIPGATDADRRAKLLRELTDKTCPWLARFRCVVAVVYPGKDIELFEGSVEGEIITEERGEHGFGYDRLFYIPEAGKTLAELDLVEKNAFSHRALAVRKAIPYLLSCVKKDQ
jgi:XTP/dITP diphosphohydrolase